MYSVNDDNCLGKFIYPNVHDILSSRQRISSFASNAFHLDIKSNDRQRVNCYWQRVINLTDLCVYAKRLCIYACMMLLSLENCILSHLKKGRICQFFIQFESSICNKMNIHPYCYEIKKKNCFENNLNVFVWPVLICLCCSANERKKNIQVKIECNLQ